MLSRRAGLSAIAWLSCLCNNNKMTIDKGKRLIAGLIVPYAKEILSISSIIFARWQRGVAQLVQGGAFGTHILGKRTS